jgi:hypothetical protein
MSLHGAEYICIDLQTMRGNQGTLLRIQLYAQVARVNSRDQMKLINATSRPIDGGEASFQWQHAHHSNESYWTLDEASLDDDRILVLDAD